MVQGIHDLPSFPDTSEVQLDSMQEKGIIEDVTVRETLVWSSHPMVKFPKKNSDKSRIIVDFTQLNHYMKRLSCSTKVLNEIVAQIPPGMGVLITLDTRHGYWQIPLAEESKA